MEDAAGRYRPSGRRLALMGLFAVIAVVAFVLLSDARFNYGEPVFDSVFDGETSRKAWTILLLAIEAMALIGMLMLLLIRPRSADWSPDEWVPAGTLTGSGSRIQIGCPGCGTVFEKASTEVDEPHEQDFRCPNCGRSGRLRLGLHKAVTIRDVACGNCGRDFKSYRDNAECPHCHAPQA